MSIGYLGCINGNDMEKKIEESRAINSSGSTRNEIINNELSTKLETTSYIDSTLFFFYEEFETEINKITWTDEPPAKLSGVILKLRDNYYLDLTLYDIPDSERFNIDRNWEMKKIENSKIDRIRLMYGDEIILDQKSNQ